MPKIQTENSTVAEFERLINMSADEIESWLRTEESKKAGWTDESHEALMLQPEGLKVAELLRRSTYEESDLDNMKRIINFIHDELDKKPGGVKLKETTWRYSLMNWGHDPIK